MPAPRASHISQLLDFHAEDLAFLWGERRIVLASPEHTPRDYSQLTERIEAHIQGLLVAPTAALLERIEPALADGDRDEVFAAACAALRTQDATATGKVIAEFSRASGADLAGLRDAFGFAPATSTADELRRALEQAKPATATAAAVALANHQLLDPAAPRLAQLLLHEDPALAALAWHSARLADVRQPTAAPARPYGQALAHADSGVRDAAWASAAWTGQTAALTPLRKAALEGDRIALQWLAILGEPEDAQALGRAALAIESPAERCALLARYGHPLVLNALVRWVGDDDAAQAHAAGEAFMLITGEDVRGERRELPVREGADDFEREMAPLVWMPDAKRARDLLGKNSERWSTAARWRRGQRIDLEPSAEVLHTLDLQSRWDTAARFALRGRRLSAPPPICG